MKKWIVIVLVWVISFSGNGEEVLLSGKTWKQELAYSSAVFMSAGPRKWDERDGPKDNSTGKFYRLYFVLNEVYFSVIIEEMSFSGEEGSKVSSNEAVFINGLDVGKNTQELPRLTNLQFIEWKSWNSFVLKEQELLLRFKINSGNMVSVVAISSVN